jgi:hypothetical protein
MYSNKTKIKIPNHLWKILNYTKKIIKVKYILQLRLIEKIIHICVIVVN